MNIITSLKTICILWSLTSGLFVQHQHTLSLNEGCKLFDGKPLGDHCRCKLFDGKQLGKHCRCQLDPKYEKGLVRCYNLPTQKEISELFEVLHDNHEKLDSNRSVNKDSLFHISELSIVNSSIYSVNQSDFEHVGVFYKLDLSHNELSELKQGIFHDLVLMRQLNLAYNRIVTLYDWFDILTDLQWLSLAHNRLEHIETHVLQRMPKLLYLDFSYNRLHTVEGSWFQGLRALHSLNLSHNIIVKVNQSSFIDLQKLLTLNMSNNRLLRLKPDTLANQTELQNLLLDNNHLIHISSRLLRNNHKLKNVTLIGNQWSCDDKLEWILHRFYSEVELGEEISHKGPIFCHSPSKHINKTLLEWIKYLTVESSFTNSSVCKVCDCSVDKTSMAEVDCRNRSLHSMPGDLPYSTGKVRLEDNRIRSVAIDPEFESHWSNIRHLYLDGNLIDSLKPMEGKIVMKKMFRLSLTRNQLHDIPIYILDQLPASLTDIYLAHNPWVCHCNTVRFKTWLLIHHQQVKDIENISCHSVGSDGDDSMNGQAITYLLNSELCPQAAKGMNYLDLLNITISILIVSILAKLFYDWQWQKKTGKLPLFFRIQIK